MIVKDTATLKFSTCIGFYQHFKNILIVLEERIKIAVTKGKINLNSLIVYLSIISYY